MDYRYTVFQLLQHEEHTRTDTGKTTFTFSMLLGFFYKQKLMLHALTRSQFTIVLIYFHYIHHMYRLIYI